MLQAQQKIEDIASRSQRWVYLYYALLLITVACGSAKTIHTPAAATATGTNQASGSGSTAAVSMLEAGTTLALTLGAGSTDTVFAVGRTSGTTMLVAMASGTAFNVNLSAQTSAPLAPPYPASTASSVLMTTSASYAWEYDAVTTTLGRNIGARVSGQNVQIGKASFSDLLATGETALPLAVTDTQIFFATKSSLLVFAWQNAAIERRKIPYSTWTLASGETVVGAGPTNPGSDDEAYWVATNHRLMQFATGQWQSQSWQLPATSAPQLISLYYAQTGASLSNLIVGALSGNALSAFSLNSALAAPQTVVATSGG